MANTLKFGAGNWATKEGSTLAYNDENNNFKPLPFTFTRASSGTVVNKAGLIETVGNGIPRIDFLGNTQGALKLEPQRTNLITQSEAFGDSYWTKSGASVQGDPSTAGSELIVNGDFATDSDWAKDTGWTISGGLLNCNTTISNNTRQLISSYSTSKVYLITYTVSNYVSGGVRIDLGYNNGATRTANGTYTEQMSFVNGGAFNGYLRIFSNGASNLKIDNVSVKEVQGFTSPDGTNNAYKFVEGTNNGQHQIFPTSSTGTDAVRTISFFVKMDGVSKIGIRNNDGKYITYDIVNNTTLDKTITNDFVSSDFNNGWKKLSITWDSTTVLTGARIFLLNDAYTSGNPLTYSYIGDGTSGIYLFGAQAEEGSYATSYIPTQGSAVTRLAESCDNAGNDQVFNSTEGVLYTEISALVDDNTIRMIQISDGTNGNRVIIYYKSGGTINGALASGGSTVVDIPFSATFTNTNKVAIRYKLNDVSLWINGVKVGEDLSANSPIGLDRLSFNQDGGANYFYGNTKDVRVYNTALTDAELIALTS